ncbi:hypothetical protein H6P81_013329 [Aristolochia fimbriata]|uniref:Sister chromatid cohesion 1 protein 2 n=1 Tax=Aristolochia fimbriata TaxID=158543 RepID=A0AAV7EFL8_ARIFI|nr:hypothetical protein H6P81_013329 [Aristolochia fimbriata]
MQKRKGKESKDVELFFSQSLLSKNGPLGTIWLAAHFPRRLRKHLVAETNICASVDKILLAEVPMAFRLLGYLLIGIVRIYARKVEYLYHDCNEALIRVKDPVTTAKSPLCKEVSSSPFISISLPQSFQLDAFDLGDWEDDTTDRLTEQIPHEGMFVDEENISLSSSKLTDSWERPMTYPEMLSRGTHTDEVLLSNITEAGQKEGNLNKIHDLDLTVEKFRGHQGTFLDFGMCSNAGGTLEIYQKFENFDSPLNMMDISSLDVLKPFDLWVGESDKSWNLEASKEVLQGNALRQEDDLNLGITCGSSQASNLPSRNLEANNEVLQGISCGASQASNPQCPNEQKKQEEVIKVLEVVPLGVEKSVVPQVRSPVSTPKSNIPYPSVIATPESMMIHTPKRREQTPMQQRRKRSFDETIVLSNLAIRQGLHDTSSLVRRRKIAPHTSQDLWWQHVISILQHDFLEPLNPYIALELKALFAKDDINHQSSVNLESALLNGVASKTPVESSHEKALSPKEFVIDQMDPTCLEVPETYSEMIPEASIANQREEMHAIESPDALNLMNEEISCELHENKDGWSVRTRAVAQYLHNSFLHDKEHNGDGVLSLFDILKGRSKTECVRLFYETLVLKSDGYIDVRQDTPYGEILLLTTMQIEAIS